MRVRGLTVHLALGVAVLAGSESVPIRAARAQEYQYPQITVRTTERDFFRRGDKVSVSIRAATDGYVTVFRVDTDGRIRVMYPREPWVDNYFVGGREYRISDPYGHSERHAFVVDDYPGVGYVFAIVSLDPFEYERLVLNDHWDYRAMATSGRISGDPYVAFGEIVESMLPSGYTAYGFDVVPYFVERQYEYPRFLCYDCHAYVAYPVWDPYRDWCGTFRVVIYEDVYRYPARVYPATRVVYPTVQPIQPRYIIKTRTQTEPFIIRVRGAANPSTRRVPDRGVRGRDLGGTGSVPTPSARRSQPSNQRGGLGGLVRRLLGSESEQPSRQPTVKRDDRTKPTPQARPQLERRTPTKPAAKPTERRPSTEPRRPTKSSAPAPQRRPEVRAPAKRPNPPAARQPSSQPSRRPAASPKRTAPSRRKPSR
jgi:hypothetical protein